MMFWNENEVKRPNGLIRTSSGVLNVVETTSITGMRVNTAIAMSTTCRVTCPAALLRPAVRR